MNPEFRSMNAAALEEEAARLEVEASRLETFADEVIADGYEPYAEDVVVSAFRTCAVYMRRDADEARAAVASTLIEVAPAAPWLLEWAAAMRGEAGCLERSASSLEDVAAENEAAGYGSWQEDMAADAYRRLAAYLRKDAAAALEHAAPAQPITEIDAARAAARPAPRRPAPGTRVFFCMEETYASIASRQLMPIEAADAFASSETGEQERMRFNEDVHVKGTHFSGNGYCVWIEEQIEDEDIEF